MQLRRSIIIGVATILLGLRLAYSDGCGRDDHNSYACHREDRIGGPEEMTGGYLGPTTTVADSERRGVLEALQTDEDMLLVLTDSMAAKATTINLAMGSGAAPDPASSETSRQRCNDGRPRTPTPA